MSATVCRSLIDDTNAMKMIHHFVLIRMNYNGNHNKQIYLNEVKFNIKWLSWYELSGLNVHTMNWYLNWIVDNVC